MKLDWSRFLNKNLVVVLKESYGAVREPVKDKPIYEIVIQTGQLIEVFDDALMLETERDGARVLIFISFDSIKCIEIHNT